MRDGDLCVAKPTDKENRRKQITSWLDRKTSSLAEEEVKRRIIRKLSE
jgi:hypothetical protein